MTLTVPFALVMLCAYVQEFPYELVEAALVEGASRWRAFRSVVIPVMTSGLVRDIRGRRTWMRDIAPAAGYRLSAGQPVTFSFAQFEFLKDESRRDGMIVTQHSSLVKMPQLRMNLSSG
jgi:Binding-protein-dependent transport system inner membrane component